MPIRVTAHNKSAYLVQRDLIIGRGEAADLRIDDPSLSRVHASLGLDGGRVRLTDLASSNGTRVNGELLVGSRLVQVGDHIVVGDVVVALYFLSPAAPGTGSHVEPDPLAEPVGDPDETRTVRQPSVAAPRGGGGPNGSDSR